LSTRARRDQLTNAALACRFGALTRDSAFAADSVPADTDLRGHVALTASVEFDPEQKSHLQMKSR
jgi:hypothetical protein